MKSASPTVMPSVNPATSEVIGEVQIMPLEAVRSLVEEASRAGTEWQSWDFRDRAAVIIEWANAVRADLERISILEALDVGMPIRVARQDLRRAIARMEYFAGLVWEVKGFTYPADAGSFVYSIRQPYGVVAVITPFNHPALFALSKVAAPLLTGNTVVIKPPEQGSLSTIAIAELLPKRAPAGIVKVITGDRTTGEALVRQPLVRKVSFTGSIAAGRSIMADASERIVPVVLELGGKNANVVLPDAPLDKAVAGAVGGMALGVCGQSCQSGTRLFLHETIHDEFVEALVARLSTVRIGDPALDDTEMGPLISAAQRDRVIGHIQGAREEGARLRAGGAVPVMPGPLANGYFIEPTILDQVRPSMAIAREEVFGPVLSIFSWRDEAELLEQVNALEFGLTASIWTESLTAHRLARQIDAGYVYINQHGGTSEGAPFGGWKQSGLGTEHSIDELFEFTRVKTVDARLTEREAVA